MTSQPGEIMWLWLEFRHGNRTAEERLISIVYNNAQDSGPADAERIP